MHAYSSNIRPGYVLVAGGKKLAHCHMHGADTFKVPDGGLSINREILYTFTPLAFGRK